MLNEMHEDKVFLSWWSLLFNYIFYDYSCSSLICRNNVKYDIAVLSICCKHKHYHYTFAWIILASEEILRYILLIEKIIIAHTKVLQEYRVFNIKNFQLLNKNPVK